MTATMPYQKGITVPSPGKRDRAGRGRLRHPRRSVLGAVGDLPPDQEEEQQGYDGVEAQEAQRGEGGIARCDARRGAVRRAHEPIDDPRLPSELRHVQPAVLAMYGKGMASISIHKSGREVASRPRQSCTPAAAINAMNREPSPTMMWYA